MKTIAIMLACLTMTMTTDSNPTDYKTAYNRAQQGDKPLLVLVTAQWCPPCKVMKSTTIPELMKRNAFKDFHYATVDLDADQQLARQLIGTGGVPQLIMFEKNNDRWVKRHLKGIQTTNNVEAFIARAKSPRTASAVSAK